MTHRAQSAFWGSLVHKIVVADCQCDDPWALGLPAAVSPVCVKMVHQINVVDCLCDDPLGTVSFVGQIAPSDCCCGLLM